MEAQIPEQVDYRARAEGHFLAGRFREAWEWLAKGIAVEHEVRDAAILRALAASTRMLQGHPDQALELRREALRLAQSTQDPMLLVTVLLLGIQVDLLRLDHEQALRMSEWAQELCTAHGVVVFQHYAAFSIARHYAMRSAPVARDQLDVMRECLARVTKLNLVGLRRILLVSFAEACGRYGLTHEAQDAICESIEVEGTALYLAEAWRVKATLVASREEALECLAHAMALARDQDALWFALRIATDRACMATGHERAEALRALRGIRAAIREGSGLEDLGRADAVLNGTELQLKALTFA